MEIIGGFLIFLAIGMISYFYVKKRQLDEISRIESTLHAADMIQEQQKVVKEQITQKVETFLENSQYFNLIGTFKNQKVYQYIYNNGYLYEFKDFMDAKNHRFGMSDEEICFKQMSYSRVENPTIFLEKFNIQLKEKNETQAAI